MNFTNLFIFSLFIAENPCLVDNGGCSQICHRSPYGVICDCNKGYHLANNSKTVCEDIDECVDQPGVCSQKCTNTKGSYKCFCISGYTLHDHHRCKANGKLYFPWVYKFAYFNSIQL